MSTVVAARRASGWKDTITALPWIAPTLLLIAAVVIYPTILMFQTRQKYTPQGGARPAGFANSTARAFTFPTAVAAI